MERLRTIRLIIFLTDIDGAGNARWMPCSTACSGVTAGLTGTTKHVDVRDYTANVKENNKSRISYRRCNSKCVDRK